MAVINDLLQIFRSSVSAVLPEKLIKNTIKYNSAIEQLSIAGENYNLINKNVFLVGTGKAVQNMAREVENILGARIKQGIISIPVGSKQNIANGNVIYYEGANNNLPDTKAEATATKVKKLVSGLTSDDILLVLISGGGSALLPLPKEPITLDEKSQLVKKLANAGADIMELNTVRKKISDLKGGQLAIKAQPANVVALVLSDIVGDPLDLIASGPTTENEDPPKSALKIIEKFELHEQLPKSIKTILREANDYDEFPKNKVKNYIIGSNKISINAAVDSAKDLNYLPIDLSSEVIGNVVDIAQEYVKLTELFCNFMTEKDNIDVLKKKVGALNIPGIRTESINDNLLKFRDVCLILGGEITVEVKGVGKGGRNQQLALEFSNIIHRIKDNFTYYDVYLLSAGTDGIDGPTDAAGAMGYLDLVSHAKQLKIDTYEYLSNNDSYSFYKLFKQGDLHVITGHTDTNVMDIHLLIIRRKNE